MVYLVLDTLQYNAENTMQLILDRNVFKFAAWHGIGAVLHKILYLREFHQEPNRNRTISHSE